MATETSLFNSFHNENAPPGLPSSDEVLAALDPTSPRGWFAYPSPDAPTCWVKHGFTVDWNEVVSQHLANTWLAQTQSVVRAPTVYFAFQHDSTLSRPTTVIVMEYIPGKTLEQLWEDADEAEQETYRHRVADAFMALSRIPVDPSKRSPSAVDGSHIKHQMFDDRVAPRLYENVQQLQDHLNLLSKRLRGNTPCNMAEEPLVYCFSDLHMSNFMIDEDGRMAVVDFAHTSFVPASMALFPARTNRLYFDISALVDIPGANPAQVVPLGDIAYRLDISGMGLARLNREIDGGDNETQKRLGSRVITKVG
ncbi:Protein kinase-like domain protein [Niveomyces insectorum RCEF 264]|uniref:Protein kinase-like domain protein n=1 Tax=Niveomyces insectorum RCEF 264 TaxID=1081102 RepID=A0A167RXB6_9HYPO|nr:Protein kinase-like domain protein [Niveomyces insectorum RCEF 264]